MAKKQQIEREFQLENADAEKWWCTGPTPEEAVASAIKDGCEFTGRCELYEMTKLGDFDLEKKTVATPIKK